MAKEDAKPVAKVMQGQPGILVRRESADNFGFTGAQGGFNPPHGRVLGVHHVLYSSPGICLVGSHKSVLSAGMITSIIFAGNRVGSNFTLQSLPRIACIGFAAYPTKFLPL